MLNRIARGVPRFSITSERLSLSTRFSSLPKLDLARRAEITMPSLGAVLVIGMNSPVHLSELYSHNFRLSMARVPLGFQGAGFCSTNRAPLPGIIDFPLYAFVKRTRTNQKIRKISGSRVRIKYKVVLNKAGDRYFPSPTVESNLSGRFDPPKKKDPDAMNSPK